MVIFTWQMLRAVNRVLSTQCPQYGLSTGMEARESHPLKGAGAYTPEASVLTLPCSCSPSVRLPKQPEHYNLANKSRTVKKRSRKIPQKHSLTNILVSWKQLGQNSVHRVRIWECVILAWELRSTGALNTYLKRWSWQAKLQRTQKRAGSPPASSPGHSSFGGLEQLSTRFHLFWKNIY